MQEVKNDTELLQNLADGDEGAFREIYDKYWKSLYRTAVQKTGSEDNAQEIVQDIFVDLWEKRYQLKIEQLDRYLFRAVKYKLIDFLRSQVIREKYQQAVWATGALETTITEDSIGFQELSRAVSAGIDQLPPKTREIFQLNRIDGYNAKEIAHNLKLPERTIEYHITQGLRIMRLHLKDFIICIIIFRL